MVPEIDPCSNKGQEHDINSYIIQSYLMFHMKEKSEFEGNQ